MRRLPVVLVSGVILAASAALGSSWPQFRGTDNKGVATDEQKLPTEIGPDQNVIWKTPLPPGHSSPVVWGPFIFLTAERDGKLLTIEIDRPSGRILWKVEA